MWISARVWCGLPGAGVGNVYEQVGRYTCLNPSGRMSHPAPPTIRPRGFGIRKRLIALTYTRLSTETGVAYLLLLFVYIKERCKPYGGGRQSARYTPTCQVRRWIWRKSIAMKIWAGRNVIARSSAVYPPGTLLSGIRAFCGPSKGVYVAGHPPGCRKPSNAPGARYGRIRASR